MAVLASTLGSGILTRSVPPTQRNTVSPGFEASRIHWTDRSNTGTIAPLLKEVGIKYDFVHYNGSFLEETIYRQRGSPEVDDAWDELGVNCMLYHPRPYFTATADTGVHAARAGVISKEEGLKSGLTDAHVQRADKYGGGFFVNVEGMHHLHCLVRLQFSGYKKRACQVYEANVFTEPRSPRLVLQLRLLQGDGNRCIRQ